MDGKRDSCRGDSGSPLVWENEVKQHVVVGITSYGYVCAIRGIPAVHTDVRAHREWIIPRMNNFDLFYLRNDMVAKEDELLEQKKGIFRGRDRGIRQNEIRVENRVGGMRQSYAILAVVAVFVKWYH